MCTLPISSVEIIKSCEEKMLVDVVAMVIIMESALLCKH